MDWPLTDDERMRLHSAAAAEELDEDDVLARHPDFVRGREEADADLRAGRTTSLNDFAREVEGDPGPIRTVEVGLPRRSLAFDLLIVGLGVLVLFIGAVAIAWAA